MKRFYKRSLLLAIRNLLQRIPFRPVDINRLHFLEYTGVPNLVTALHRTNCEVRRATPKDLPGMAECQRTPEAFLKRFEMKDHCAVAIIRGQIVGYEWFCEEPVHLEERYGFKVEIPREAVYAYDAYILPEHRLSGIWVKFKTTYLRQLMERSNKQRIITMIDAGNHMSMNTHLRFGFRPVRSVLVFKLFGKSFFINTSAEDHKLPFPFRASITDVLEHAEEKESWPSKSAVC